MKPYTFAAPARVDLQGIREYLATASRTVQARLLTRLKVGFQQAAEFPLSGRREPEFSDGPAGSIRSILVYPYLIFYRAEISPTVIVAITHGSQDIPTLLKSRTMT